PRLVAYARRRLVGDAAVDAVSEAMVRAVARVDRFVWEGAGFEAWLFGILRHVVLAVRAAFERLGPANQELLELRVMAGLSAEAVGQVLGKRPGAVRMAQNRALGRLRALMEETAR